MNYRIVTIPRSITTRVRTELRDPIYKHPAHRELASGYGPCRQCLAFFEVGAEQRILFTHDSFLGVDSIRQPGPVFIHAEECDQYDPAGGFPEHLTSHTLTFEAYGKGKQLRHSITLAASSTSAAIEQLLADSHVDYIIVRDTDAGCFDCAIVRDSEGQ
jgi:hypothetical protein